MDSRVDRDALAAFLRTRRARVRPHDAGLTGGGRRRTPGLRREEVAALAGISTDYYARLEQARGPRPSRQVLLALARALRLSDVERDHLVRLAGEAAPAPGTLSRTVPSGVLRLVDRIDDVAIVVLSAGRDVLAWNPLAEALFGDLSVLPEGRRNFLWLAFRGHERVPADVAQGLPVLSCIHPDDRAAYAAEGARELRATLARYPGDRRLGRLVDDLRNSPEFARAWESQDVAGHVARTKRLLHPVVGELDLDQQVLLVPEHDQTVVTLSAAPGTASSHALGMLRVIGTQRLSEAPH